MICGDGVEIGGRVGGCGEIFGAIVVDPELGRIVGPLMGFDLLCVSWVVISTNDWLSCLGHIKILFLQEIGICQVDVAINCSVILIVLKGCVSVDPHELVYNPQRDHVVCEACHVHVRGVCRGVTVYGSFPLQLSPPNRILPLPGECCLPLGLSFYRIELDFDLILLLGAESVVIRPDDIRDDFEARGVGVSVVLVDALVE